MDDDPDVDDDTVLEQLEGEDTLVEGPSIVDEGWSPGERPRAVDSWGTTAREESEGEPLDGRLSREELDPSSGVLSDASYNDGLGDSNDTDGELRDDEVGDSRAGRLVSAEDDDDSYAVDAGVDGAGASAEEAAVHLVPDSEDR